MSKSWFVLLAPLAITPVFADDSSPLKTETQQFSYSLGLEIGQQVKQLHEQANLDIPSFKLGLTDTLGDVKPRLTDEEIAKVRTAFLTRLRQQAEEKQKVLAEGNKIESDVFLKENAKQDGVKVTDSGLQYKVMKQGDGPKPKPTDIVTVNYKGTLLDGKEFDSSYKRGQPATFPVNGVIQGWQEALQLMPVGSKYELFIPADLAYGATGVPGGPIGPNAALIFEVELLSIDQQPTEDEAAAPNAE